MQAKNVGCFVLVVLLAACGGGGGGSASVGGATSNTLSGVAAVGAPMASAAIKLTCADGTVKTTTADSNGAYSFTATDIASCQAPYVLSATGQVGDTQDTLVSVLPTTISGSQNLNITPVTHAIAATLASNGDPLKLVDSIATEKSGITSISVFQRATALQGALSGLLTSAGLPANFDLLSGSFTANSSGFDKVLDNLKVDVKAGGVEISNVGASVQDDMGSLTTAPAADFSSSGIRIDRTTNFASALSTIPAQIQDTSIADIFQTQLNNCFGSASSARGTVSSLGATCSVLQFASDYLNDGRNAASEFNYRLQGQLYDNAKFGKPEIIRFLSASPTDTRALVSLSLTRTDGITEQIVTVVENSTTTGGVLKLRGNQRPYYLDISGVVQKRSLLAARLNSPQARSTFYATGLNIYLDYNVGNAHTLIKYVKITGPLLPVGGIYLRKSVAGCTSYFSIFTHPTNAASTCSAVYQLSSREASASDTDNWASKFGNAGSPNFAPAKISDADILAVQSNAAYKVEVFLEDNTTATYYQRLRSRPYTMGSSATLSGEIDTVKWQEGLQQSSIDAMTPSSSISYTTPLSAFTVAYVRTPNAAPPFKVYYSTQPTTASTLKIESVFLPISPNYVAGDVISSSLTTSGGWPEPRGLLDQTNAFNMIQFVSRNRFGTTILRDYRY